MSDKPYSIDRVADFAVSASGQVLLAGLVGGVLRWLTTEKTWRGGLASIVSGLASAWYLGPPTAALLSDKFSIPNDNPQLVSGVAFVVGIGGTSLIAFVVAVFRSLNAKGFAVRFRDSLLVLFGFSSIATAAPSNADEEQGGPQS